MLGLTLEVLTAGVNLGAKVPQGGCSVPEPYYTQKLSVRPCVNSLGNRHKSNWHEALRAAHFHRRQAVPDPDFTEDSMNMILDRLF